MISEDEAGCFRMLRSANLPHTLSAERATAEDYAILWICYVDSTFDGARMSDTGHG